MKRNADTLAAVSELLWGRTWQTGLAEWLTCSRRTVVRWNAGEFEVPDDLFDDLARLCDERARDLKDMARNLRGNA